MLSRAIMLRRRLFQLADASCCSWLIARHVGCFNLSSKTWTGKKHVLFFDYYYYYYYYYYYHDYHAHIVFCA